jgi:hypothetical protein
MSHDQPAGQPAPTEYLGDAPRPRRGGRRWGLVGGAAVAVVGAAAAAAWGVSQFLGAGPEPATAAPANTLAYVGLDLDPSGGQKIEALKTLRKFPGLEDKLGIGSSDDLKRSLLEKLVKESSCDGLDYADDIEPWLGDKVGFGAVPGGDGPVPFAVVQVSDETKARRGVAALGVCGSDGGPGAKVGIAFVGDYMVLAETDTIAAGIVADVDKGSLADDPTYQKWVDEAGGDGILTAYVSPDGLRAAVDAMGPLGDPFATSGHLSSTDVLTADPSATPGASSVDDVESRTQKALADFQGGAVVARFDNEAFKVELAAGGLPAKVGTGGDSGITDLPSSTAMALALGVSDTFAQDFVDGLRRSMGSDQVDGILSEVETSTGLTLPQDLQTLLGNGVSVAVDDSIDVGAFGGAGGSAPSDLPLGVRITGDPSKIMPVVQKVLDVTGAGAQGVVVEQGSGAVAIGVSRDYLKRLAADGDLGGQPRFAEALPDLRAGSGALYVDFDAGDWLMRTLDNAPDSADLRANLQPLSALGVTGDMDGSTMHAVVRLTTD